MAAVAIAILIVMLRRIRQRTAFNRFQGQP
jgi:hypothetical protein